MTSIVPPLVVDLTANDEAAFQSFSCYRGTHWSRAIEVMVQTQLADAITQGNLKALGIWDPPHLAAVAAYKDQLLLQEWRLDLVGTNPAWANRGYATKLITTVRNRARVAGARRVSGHVFHENHDLISVVRALDAVVFPRPSDVEYLAFVIAV